MDIKRCTVEDNELVVNILKHPSIYKWVSDDYSCSAENVDYRQFLAMDSVYVLLQFGGCLTIFIPRNGITWEVHSASLPETRGKNMVLAGKNAVQWMFANTPCRKIVTAVPTFNPLAMRLSRMCGMAEEGNDRKSFLKDGVLYDQILYGITKEEYLCQP
jgi:hypothetical protein